MNYTPAQLAQLIQDGQYSAVESNIIDFVVMNSSDKNFIKLAESVAMKVQNKIAYEQQCVNAVGVYANLIVSLFCAPQYIPSDEILNKFLVKKQTVELIFSLSSWQTSDPIIEKLGLLEITTITKYQISKRKIKALKVLLALYCLGSKHKLPWTHLFELDVNLTFRGYLGLVTQTVSTLTEDRDQKYNELLTIAADFPTVTIDEITASLVAAPYFSCSYATGENKYALKKWVANILLTNTKRWVDQSVIHHAMRTESRKIRSKPIIGLVLEHYTTTHAMFRYYNSHIRHLASEYELVAFINKEQLSLTDLSAFSKTISIDDQDDLNKHVQLIMDADLDILFYPSIGMAPWVLFLSFMRLAPIQFMTGGHPSSSFSKNIDYFVIPDNSFTTKDIQPFISEKVIMATKTSRVKGFATRYPGIDNHFLKRSSQYLPVEDEFVIGINGVLRKVSSVVMQICKEIEQRSTKKLRFIFFSLQPEFHLAFMSTKIQMQQYLSSFELVGYSDYRQYLTTLSKCHLLLPTLPFGGSNSNVDAMILKKPKLFLDARRHLYTRSDMIDWSYVELQNEMGCSSIEEIINKALNIIEHESVRSHYYEVMQNNCPLEDIFFDDTQESGPSINHHIELMIRDFETSLANRQAYV